MILGVLFNNYVWFLARWFLVLLVVSGKSLISFGNHLLAQMIKIPKSTSIAHVLMPVEI